MLRRQALGLFLKQYGQPMLERSGQASRLQHGLPIRWHLLLRGCALLGQAAVWTALNGLGLALVMPCAQSIMAEIYAAKDRGRAFGTLFTLSAFGGILPGPTSRGGMK